MMHKKTATVISLAALAAAQISVSSQCQAGITALTSNEEASRCLAINQLSNILLTKSDASIINPINTWLVAFCGAPECSPETLDTVATSLANACESDLGSLGLSPDQVQLVIPYIKQYFSTAKQVICLADTSEDAFCATSLAHDVEDAIGQPLSLNTLVGAYTSGSSPVSSNITCTKCTQGELSILSQQTQLDTLFNIQGPVASACGEEFAATTTMPAGIVVGTGTAVPKGNGENNNDGPDGASTLAIAGSLVAVAGAVLLGLLA